MASPPSAPHPLPATRHLRTDQLPPANHDVIHIRDLTVSCIVGTRPEERRRKRRVVLDITLACDLAQAGHSDDLRHSVDYAAVGARVRRVVAGSRCLLIERLAQLVADTCLAVTGVTGVKVTLDKPGALRGCRSVAVEIERLNTEH